MLDITKMLANIEAGAANASDQLLPLVYKELRAIAAQKMSQEPPGATIQATALVHEAYLRLVGSGNEQQWSHRGHFFAAAAESMRRILVEIARAKSRQKRGGQQKRQVLHESTIEAPIKSDQVLAIDEALERLKQVNPQAAQLVNLRYFAGFTIEDSARAMEISPRKANQVWAYARAWLADELGYES
ncbi:MAG: sigma-70 family RNA polymerase sigma factor [Planctomycetaceae bacterium]